MIKAFAESISQLLLEPLPGPAAHRVMAPISRQVQQFNRTDYPDAKTACVLVLFYPKGADIHLVLIKRPDYEGVHGGQVSFPGGKYELSDEDETYTALRETEEEIGVNRSVIRVLGQLSHLYIPPSNFFVYPFLGFTESMPEFIPDTTEVAGIIEVPISVLLEASSKSTVSIKRSDVNFEAPCYILEGHVVWGATAIILSELEWLLKKLPLNT